MTEFRIVYFDEIADPYAVTLLFQLSLYWPGMPKVLEEIRTYDDRYTREFGIFAVAKDGTVAGGHLLMRIPTVTKDGELEVGGVNAVGTRPDFARRGVMTSVMNATHEYFKGQGLALSVLTTSKRLGAMVMYERLGYVELSRSSLAVKYPNKPRATPSADVTIRAFSEDDVASIDSVFRGTVAGSYGFIRRPDNFLRARKYNAGEMKPKENLRIAQRADKMTGYAYWDSNPRNSEGQEIIALDKSTFCTLLSDAEQRNLTAGVLVWCDGLTNLEIGWLRDAGYQVPIEAYGRAVFKSMEGKTDSNALKKLYGIDEGKFRLGLWDGT